MDSTWHYFHSESDTAVGPLDEATLQTLRRGGTITDDTLITRDGGQQWVPFREVLGSLQEGSSGFTWKPWLLIAAAMVLSFFPFASLGHAGFLYGFIGAPLAIIMAQVIRGPRSGQPRPGRARRIFMSVLVYPLAVLAILPFVIMFAAKSYASGSLMALWALAFAIPLGLSSGLLLVKRQLIRRGGEWAIWFAAFNAASALVGIIIIISGVVASVAGSIAQVR